MEKSQFETYEFFPANTEAGSEQFFVVQEDGTYLINRQVQFVTQVEDVKTVLDGQPCTVYDVSEVSDQPFYVDVDNSSELMSVSDQFVLPEASSNIYANSYLLQPSTTSEQVKENITDVQLPSNSTADLDAGTVGKPINNYTEITLTDDQYQKLELKGYILLEISGKFFVLDTLGGLRDITSNDKLIQKLKSDDQSNIEWDKSADVKVENNLSPMDITTPLTPQPNAMEFMIASDTPQSGDNIGHLPSIVSNSNKDNVLKTFVNQEIKTTSLKPVENNESAMDTISSASTDRDAKVFLVENEKEEEENTKNIIRIKTKLSLKDIPDKIVLGKTTNGKTLVARVKKPETPKNNLVQSEVNINIKKSARAILDPEDILFPDLIKQAILQPEQSMTVKDLQSLDMIIGQLTQVPSFNPSINGDNFLFITKIVKTESDKEKNSFSKSKPIIWTGRVKEIDYEWRFEHLPYILQNLLFTEECNKTDSSTIIHIQILEEVSLGTNIIKTSVTVNKKQLLPGRPRKKETVYACSACAAVFNTELELKNHQEEYLHTMDTNGLMHMDVDQSKSTYTKLSGKNKYYACMICNVKFAKLSHCQSHMKTHGYNQTNEASQQGDGAKTKTNSVIYKCNMCNSTYSHQSTLSKHIVSKHIRNKI